MALLSVRFPVPDRYIFYYGFFICQISCSRQIHSLLQPFYLSDFLFLTDTFPIMSFLSVRFPVPDRYIFYYSLFICQIFCSWQIHFLLQPFYLSDFLFLTDTFPIMSFLSVRFHVPDRYIFYYDFLICQIAHFWQINSQYWHFYLLSRLPVFSPELAFGTRFRNSLPELAFGARFRNSFYWLYRLLSTKAGQPLRTALCI